MPASQAAKIERLLISLFHVYPFRELRAMLGSAGLMVPNTKSKAIDELKELTGSAADRAITILSDFYAGVVIAGTKEVFVFDVSDDDVEDIGESLAEIEVPQNEFSISFPVAISETALKSLQSDHQLAKKILHPSGDISLVLCAKRSSEERVTYQYSQVSLAVKESFEDFDEFVTVRRANYQVFDVVTLRRSLGRLEVLIDQPAKIKRPNTSGARCREVLGRLSSLSGGIARIYEANSPLNLAPCVGSMYHAPHEGRVSQMRFRAPSGSVNKGAVASEDLRNEAFHAGGTEAVGDVTPYDVTITWDNLVHGQGAVGLQVGMPLKMLSVSGGVVDHARIIDAQSDAVVAAVVNKLVSYSTG